MLHVCIKCGIMAYISIDIATDYLLITLLSVNLKRGVIKLRLDDLGLVDNALVGQPLRNRDPFVAGVRSLLHSYQHLYHFTQLRINLWWSLIKSHFLH